MTKKNLTKVALCMPIYGYQSANFWVPFTREVADSFQHGVHFSKFFSATTMATDKNRNEIVRQFLESDLEWSYWHDADNINPAWAASQLLQTAITGDYKIATGIYFLKAKPYAPVIYRRQPDGRYDALENWSRGEIVEVDAAGMNCVLIHRSVFEDIKKNYRVVQRLHSGGLVPVHKDDIQGDLFDSQYDEREGKVIDGVFYQRVIEPATKTNVPFFFMEYNRTEDMAFFEMARRLDYKIAADTRVECGHLREVEIAMKDHAEAMSEQEDEE